MPIYVYKCQQWHYHEETHSILSYPKETRCPECDGEARLVLRPSFVGIDVDWQDRVGFDLGAGRYFSNRGERRDWMKQHDMIEIGSEPADKLIDATRERGRETRRRRYDEAIKKIPSGFLD